MYSFIGVKYPFAVVSEYHKKTQFREEIHTGGGVFLRFLDAGCSYLKNDLEKQTILNKDDSKAKTLSKENFKILNFVISESNKIYQEGEFVPPGHFYSAVPSAATRQSYADAVKPRIKTLLDIEINREEQIRVLEGLPCFYKSCPFPHDKDAQWRYFYNNSAYSYGDGMTLQAFAPLLSDPRYRNRIRVFFCSNA